jgi:hypothetical protein
VVTSFFNQPTKLKEGHFVRHSGAVGVPADFEAFEATTKYANPEPAKGKGRTYEIIEPARKMPINPFPLQLTRLIESLWTHARVSEGQQRSAFTIGERRDFRKSPVNIDPTPYHYQPPLHPQVAPIGATVSDSVHMAQLNRDAFPQDWKMINDIRRTNAYTFRGDMRGPAIILKTGFQPSAMRTDDGFIKGQIFDFFKEYLLRRFNRELPAHVNADYFLYLVRGAFTTLEDREILCHYFLWRKMCEREKFHFGRMVAHECLKYYVSTTREIFTAVRFATSRDTDGWVYVTLVRGGLVVPMQGQHIIWHFEHEISQLGPIGPDHIVGFRFYDKQAAGFSGPPYFRRTFRKSEPAAFLKLYKILCGKTQERRES